MPSQKAAFNQLVQNHQGDLYRFALFLSRNADRAEDLVQDTFLRAWRFFDQLKDAGAAKAWLMTTLRREHARGFERKRFETEDLSEMELADAGAISAAELSDAQAVRNAMMQLDARYREPLLLQVIGGLSCDEIARELGQTPQSVMTQVFRARQKLKAVLAPAVGTSAVGDVRELR